MGFASFGFEIFSARPISDGWSNLAVFTWRLLWVPGVLIVVMVGFHEAMSRDGTLVRMARTKGPRIGN
ncbi:hypothetical protein [Paracoccus sp. PAR01]|uniref:hypothetical protein n=1 Tax=Paracoccus sp. PAR01 TaxID=2769282 RepID=UPI001CE13FD8|nr:hypothetical protein [Paracoccus sp. PAR01]